MIGVDPLTLGILFLVASYVTAAPDRRTAAVRAGSAGAIGAATRSAGRSIGSDWTRFGAARQSRNAAKQAARREKYGPIRKGLEAAFGEGGAVESAGRSVGTGIRAGAASARDGWRQGKEGAHTGLPKLKRPTRAAGAGPDVTTDPATPTSPPGPDAPDAGPQTTGPDSPAGNTGGDNVASNSAPELTNTAVLRAEIKGVTQDIEAASAHVKALTVWTGALPERYAAADWGTKNLTIAVHAAGETHSGLKVALKALDELRAANELLIRALNEADGLGEHIETVKAEGKTEGFKAA